MARSNILPSYLRQQPWQDLCDAIDAVFSTAVDIPTNNLGLLRNIHAISPTNTAVPEAIAGGYLFIPDQLDYFENPVLIKQINLLGLVINLPQYFTPEQLTLILRTIGMFWYSKGKADVANYLSFILGTPVTITRMWTQDYVNFLPEGDPGIGTNIWYSGPWYPTTTMQITVEGFTLPGGMPIEIFGQFLEEFINYNWVPQYFLSAPPLFVTSSNGQFVPFTCDPWSLDYQFVANFNLTSTDQDAANAGGGFESITTIALPTLSGSGYTMPSLPTASFSASVTSGSHPLTVTFTDSSSGYIIGYAWDFLGNGTIESTLASPAAFTYYSAGTYIARLTVINSAGLAHHTVTITVS